MRIASFRTGLASPAKEMDPVRDGPGAAMANFVTLQLRTDDGIEGIGYAGFVGQETLGSLKEAVDALAQHAIGDDPLDVEAIGAKLLEWGGKGAPAGTITRAVAAIDVALWDIKGKALGQPVYKLLGGFRDRIATYASGFLWRTYDASALAETGAKLVEEGFRAMKFRMGAEDSAAAEVTRMKALRDAVGDEIDLMVDINQGWDVNRSIAVGREMEKCNLFWLEDPIHHQDFDGLAHIANALDTPISAGEYHYGIPPFRHMLERRSVDIVMIDLLRAGGITPWMKIAHLAEAYNLPVVSHLAPEVLAHAVAAVPNGLIVEHMPWSLALFKEPPRIENSEIVLPQTPGLGLEFDAESLDHLAP